MNSEIYHPFGEVRVQHPGLFGGHAGFPATEPRPLMSMSAVMTLLDLDEDGVMVLVQERTLPWAFDISQGRRLRREIRVLTESVFDLVHKRKRPLLDDEAGWPRVASLIFQDKATLVTGELARAINCSRWLVMLMIHAGYFKCVAPVRIRRGPYGSPHIITASVVVWLRKRRVLA